MIGKQVPSRLIDNMYIISMHVFSERLTWFTLIDSWHVQFSMVDWIITIVGKPYVHCMYKDLRWIFWCKSIARRSNRPFKIDQVMKKRDRQNNT